MKKLAKKVLTDKKMRNTAVLSALALTVASTAMIPWA